MNTISWNETGQWLLSGSDDQNLVITNGYTYEVDKAYFLVARQCILNLFSACFLGTLENKNGTSSKHIQCQIFARYF